MNEKPHRPRNVNAIGMITDDGILSPMWPSRGKRKIVAIVDANIIF